MTPATETVLMDTVCFGGGAIVTASLRRGGELIEQRRVDALLEARPDLADEGDLALSANARDASDRPSVARSPEPSVVALA